MTPSVNRHAPAAPSAISATAAGIREVEAADGSIAAAGVDNTVGRCVFLANGLYLVVMAKFAHDVEKIDVTDFDYLKDARQDRSRDVKTSRAKMLGIGMDSKRLRCSIPPTFYAGRFLTSMGSHDAKLYEMWQCLHFYVRLGGAGLEA